MPRYYPIHLDIEGRSCLVVGGGPVAERRVRGLMDAGGAVLVVSPTLTAALAVLTTNGEIKHRQQAYDASVMECCVLVIAATSSRSVNAQIASDARARGILVNVADAPEEGDYVVPSVLRRGELCIGISTGGNPTLSARLSDDLEARFGPEYAEYVELLARMRLYIKERTSDMAMRRLANMQLLEQESHLLDPIREGRPSAAHALAVEIVDAVLKA